MDRLECGILAFVLLFIVAIARDYFEESWHLYKAHRASQRKGLLKNG